MVELLGGAGPCGQAGLEDQRRRRMGVRLHMPASAGLVVPRKRRCGSARPTQNATRRQDLACVAHFAAVCGDAAVQLVTC
eukprot:10804368-Lingulodinium_polyedra.AAC.1